MEEFVLSCCSTADLTPAHFAARNISYVCFHFSLDGVDYADDLGQSVPFDRFYREMAEGADTKTSQVSIGEYIEYFTPFLAAGKDVLHITFSSGLSGTYRSAVIAARQLQEQFPDRKLYIVDSLGASSGYGLLMDRLADLRDAGKSVDEVKAFAEENRLHVHHWFFSTDLKFYVKGGRISRTAGAIGGILGICPLLHMDAEGHLTPHSKVRTKKKVIRQIVAQMEAFAENGTAYNGKCFLSHSDCYEDARAVADLVEATFPCLDGKVCINPVGTTVGSHTGPGTVALFFFGQSR